MNLKHTLTLDISCQIKVQNAGLFISRGQGTHPTRVIDSHELILVKTGQLALWEEEQSFLLEAGQTLHLYPQRRHGGTGSFPKGLSFYWIHFEIDQSISDNSDMQTETLTIPQVNRLRRPEKLEVLFRYFLESQETGDLNQVTANLLMQLMLAEASQSAIQDNDDSDKVNSLAAMVHNYIWVHSGESITAGDVAEALGYNPDYLGRIYRKIYGDTITQAIHQSRVAQACRLLMDSEKTIEEIARICGFSDADYFRRIFRRYKHITPLAFRKINARIYVNTD